MNSSIWSCVILSTIFLLSLINSTIIWATFSPMPPQILHKKKPTKNIYFEKKLTIISHTRFYRMPSLKNCALNSWSYTYSQITILYIIHVPYEYTYMYYRKHSEIQRAHDTSGKEKEMINESINILIPCISPCLHSKISLCYYCVTTQEITFMQMK